MKSISRKALYDKIWSITKSKTATELNLKYPELSQICKEHNIPCPTSNYWIQLSLGKDVEKTPLPDPDQAPEISLDITKPRRKFKEMLSQSNGYSEILDNELAKAQEAKEVRALKSKALAGNYTIDFRQPAETWMENVSTVVKAFPVEDTLKSRREIIMQSKVYQRHLDKGDYDWLRHPDNKRKKHLSIYTEPESLDRALRLFDSLISIFEALGGRMSYDDDRSAVVFGDVNIPISISEKRRRVEIPKSERDYFNRYNYINTGLLKVSLELRWKTRNVEDTDYTKLEEKLDTVVKKALKIVEEELEWRERLRLQEIERQRQEEVRRREEERKRQLEMQRDSERQAVRGMFDRMRREMIVSLLDRIIDKAASTSRSETVDAANNPELVKLRELRSLFDPQHPVSDDSILSEQDINALACEFFTGDLPLKVPTPGRYF